jgi:hypothetical protein
MEAVPIYCNISRKEKQAIAAETKSCSKKVMSYFTKETITDECKHTAAKEGMFAFQPNRTPFLSIHGLYILSDKKTA